MKHKTETLEGAQLDAAVAKALGLPFTLARQPEDAMTRAERITKEQEAAYLHKFKRAPRSNGGAP
jgi:enoyl-CoA hydratase/carnithine racemase